MKRLLLCLGLVSAVFAQDGSEKFCLQEDSIDTTDVLAIPLDDDPYTSCIEAEEDDDDKKDD